MIFVPKNLHFRQLSFYYFSFGSRIVGGRSNRQTLDSGPDMTAWVKEAADIVLLKEKKNLRSLFKVFNKDDCVYGSTSSKLEESLISNEGRENARAQSILESGNNKQPTGMLV